jgi:hypothetical protein
MGKQKDKEIDVYEDWMLKAASEGWICKLCSETIRPEDKETYFDTGLCSSCDSLQSRDD